MEQINLSYVLKLVTARKKMLYYILIGSLILSGLLCIFNRPNYMVESKILIDRSDASIAVYLSKSNIVESSNVSLSFDAATRIVTIVTSSLKRADANDLNDEYIEIVKSKLKEVYGINSFKTIEYNQTIKVPVLLDYLKNIIICLFVGIALYLAYIMVLVYFCGITSREDVENSLELNYVGSISVDSKKVLNDLKYIQTNIDLLKDVQMPKTVLFSGVKSGSGSSSIVANLGKLYGNIYKKVLIIDADYYNKTITNKYKLEKSKGLSDVVKKKDNNKIEDVIIPVENKQMYVMPFGTIESENLYFNANFNKVIKDLKNKYDIILIDAPSLEKVASVRMSSIVDTMVIVGVYGRTKVEDILEAKKNILNVGGNIKGVIINRSL